ncbi:1-deoxy-D-xylulose-5-phosphate reductoisomerase [Camelimonas abortus]|uniref:1-deoxy-D-xylulose 5-phosphate reductoisomerase n=1 Tax=Camelimonas abortus TaxID=1017184 RepID=A0ABV7LGM5_9HYPH
MTIGTGSHPAAAAPEGRRRVTVLGATGSVGRSTAAVLAEHAGAFSVTALVAGRDVEGAAAMARRLGARFVALSDAAAGPALRAALEGSGIASGAGAAAVAEAIAMPCDVVVGAISGAAGLRPTHQALQAGRVMALANKECLVCAGEAFMRDAAARGVPVLPVDSEHNALYQALGGEPVARVERMTLTASGGPFRETPAAQMAAITPRQALAHPTWAMGPKITIDSATLMNKGLELIEAMHLFGVAPQRLEVLVHPQSVVHGLVSFADGSVTAGMASPDMRIPIGHCLGLPERLALSTPRLDLARIGQLTFAEPDLERFPCLALAREAMEAGGRAAAVLNAANEVAVAAFLAERIGFCDIPRLIGAVCERLAGGAAPASVDEALAIDAEARACAAEMLARAPRRSAAPA